MKSKSSTIAFLRYRCGLFNFTLGHYFRKTIYYSNLVKQPHRGNQPKEKLKDLHEFLKQFSKNSMAVTIWQNIIMPHSKNLRSVSLASWVIGLIFLVRWTILHPNHICFKHISIFFYLVTNVYVTWWCG